ncbi:hypothetical protein ACTOB_003144 [Actinoplanes oblitus]|uniref:Peptidase MA-like domain-containing protein n=1 Tax=Actinoplanes oblitus TaxID=3040509 RepID=A0ABY8WNP6_9ACTN|nr:hypothetical protein [Actinoplanes oblitus]WIM99489.1 hypothetical protein ACTOB_003144 [Actinoplanes oblitus]
MIINRRRRRIALLSAVTLLAVAALTACRAGHTPAAAASAAGPAAPSPGEVTPSWPRPSAGAPLFEFQTWVREEVRAAMKVQTEGLLTGDFTKFAIGAPPGDKALRAELRRRFRTLRALHVTRFDQRVDGQPRALPKAGTWQVVHVVDHCFVETDCGTDETVFDSVWAQAPEGLRLVGFRQNDGRSHCFTCESVDSRSYNRPWETTELIAQVGARTLVAVPPRYRNRLADLSRRAEKAAAVADRYRIGAGEVDRYRVFVADDAAWRRWYHHRPGAWVAGMAVATGEHRIEVELHASELTADFTDELLTHELAHVATLRNDTHDSQKALWFLIEGMAEYVQQQRPGAGDYPDRDALDHLPHRRTLRSVSVDPPADDADDRDAAGRYAVGYYAVTFLFGRYGKERTLRFFQDVVQKGIGLDGPSRSVFGKPWATVDKECAAYVRGL